MLTQKEAVFKAIATHKLPDDSFDRKAVVNELFKMYRNGEWEYGDKEKMSDDRALRIYCGSMVSNWLRKDQRLGNEAGEGRASKRKPRPVDDEMKRLMMAKVTLTREGQPTQEIDALIQQRTAQLDSERADVAAQVAASAEAILEATANQQ